MKKRPIVGILLLCLAAGVGFWLSRRQARPAADVIVEAPTDGVRLVPVSSDGGTP